MAGWTRTSYCHSGAVRAFVASLLASLLLAACGGEGGDGAPSMDTSSLADEIAAADAQGGADLRPAEVAERDAGPDVSPISDTRDVEEETSDTIDALDSGLADTGEDIPCVPLCDTKVCGPDGCGGSCGDCPAGEQCEEGACACAPDCPDPKLGIECGLDGCGGYCGCAGTAPGPFGYCDPDTRQCREVAADCEGGWCRIPPGMFLMGEVQGYPDDGPWPFVLPAHPVTLTRPFAIQATETTVAAYQEMLGEEAVPFRNQGCGPNCPMATLTVFDAMRYANRMSTRDGLESCYVLEDCVEASEWCPQGSDGTCHVLAPGIGLECARFVFAGPDCPGYRLPSEAEWEFAARAGTSTCFPNGEIDDGYYPCGPEGPQHEVAWFCGNSEVSYEGCVLQPTPGEPLEGPLCLGPHPVGLKTANAFGLHDTSGNASELTGTLFTDYTQDHQVDPGFDLTATLETGDSETEVGVSHRGGAARMGRQCICSSQRSGVTLGIRYIGGGVSIRLARTLDSLDAPLLP